MLRQTNTDYRATFLAVISPNRSDMLFNQFLDDRQTETGAGISKVIMKGGRKLRLISA